MKQRNYYRNLYTSKDNILDNVDLEEYIGQQGINKITENEANKLEGILTLTEISFTLKSIKS